MTCLVKFPWRYWGEPLLGVEKAMCSRPENEIAAATFFAKTSTALTNCSAFASQQNGRIPGNTVADSRSPAPPACCRSLPKHHVVWNCLGVVGLEMYIDFFCGFVLCWCFLFVCFVLVGLLLVGVCFLVWFLVVTSLPPSSLLQFTFDGLVYALINSCSQKCI